MNRSLIDIDHPHPSETIHNNVTPPGSDAETLRAITKYVAMRAHKAKLESMISKYRSTRLWIRMIESNLEEEQGVAVGWWKKQQEKAFKVLETCNQAAQDLVKLRIEKYKNEIENETTS